jgi:hypothetical protein
LSLIQADADLDLPRIIDRLTVVSSEKKQEQQKELPMSEATTAPSPTDPIMIDHDTSATSQPPRQGRTLTAASTVSNASALSFASRASKTDKLKLVTAPPLHRIRVVAVLCWALLGFVISLWAYRKMVAENLPDVLGVDVPVVAGIVMVTASLCLYAAVAGRLPTRRFTHLVGLCLALVMAAIVFLEIALAHMGSAMTWYVCVFIYATFSKASTSLFIYVNYLKVKEFGMMNCSYYLTKGVPISGAAFIVLRMWVYWLTELAAVVINIGQVSDIQNRSGRSISVIEHLTWTGDVRWSRQRQQWQWLWSFESKALSAQGVLVILGCCALLVFIVLGSILMSQKILQLRNDFGSDPEVRSVTRKHVANLVFFVFGLLATFVCHAVKQHEVSSPRGLASYCYGLHTEASIHAVVLVLLSGLPQGALCLWRRRSFMLSSMLPACCRSRRAPLQGAASWFPASPGQSSKVEHARRLASLKQVRKEVQEKHGCDLSSPLAVAMLETAMMDTFDAYANAHNEIQREDKDGKLVALEGLSGIHVYRAGNINELKSEDEMLGVAPEVLCQSTRDLDDLLVEALDAQRHMYQRLDPDRFVSEDSGSNWLDLVVNPAIKTRARVQAKASYMHNGASEQTRYDRVRDIARLAIVFETPEKLLRAIPILLKCFNVVDMENGFAHPSMLGWRDIKVVTSINDHMVELQLQLAPYANAKADGQRHQDALRAMLPDLGVKEKDLEDVVYTIASCCDL